MYGVETNVHPTYHGQGIGSALMDARFDTARLLNLRGVLAGSIPMDYHRVARHVSIEDYVRDVVAGKRFDTNLTKQLKKGFQVHNLIPNYLYDPRSRGWGVVIVWQNPDFGPA
jgi:GNAT superfamily N-acetyltransferase